MKTCPYLLVLCYNAVNAFVPPRLPFTAPVTLLPAIKVDLDTIADIGYTVSASKPLGVVFGENKYPYSGLVVDDVELVSLGGQVGLRVGDQLLAVNGQSVIGGDFDSVMDTLRNAPSPMELRLYRGTVSSLFSIVMNRRGENAEEEEEEVEEIIMDENYESPVTVSAEDYAEDDTISVSEVAGEAVKSIGNISKGLFGGMFSKETIQLEGDDAASNKK